MCNNTSVQYRTVYGSAMHCRKNGGVFMSSGFQVYNEQSKLHEWAQIVSRCRGNGFNISSYYKWQRKVYAAAQAQ